MEYCEDIYKMSKSLPTTEIYNLTSQIKRAVISIPLNIAEGAGTSSNKEFLQFISYAYRSVNEVLTALDLSARLKLINIKETEKHIVNGKEISRMLYSFSKKLRT
ncbi:MAG: four helix bundle protein [Candidatus Omnitrophica bacterium]|nr:four helix bundle protein [Candidatus Omnitrophota bacterium]